MAAVETQAERRPTRRELRKQLAQERETVDWLTAAPVLWRLVSLVGESLSSQGIPRSQSKDFRKDADLNFKQTKKDRNTFISTAIDPIKNQLGLPVVNRRREMALKTRIRKWADEELGGYGKEAIKIVNELIKEGRDVQKAKKVTGRAAKKSPKSNLATENLAA